MSDAMVCWRTDGMVHMARKWLAPMTEKADTSAALPMCFWSGITEMQVNIKQIERLRAAAVESGEVSDLLMNLAEAFPFFKNSDKTFCGDEDCAQYLSDAMVAAEFVEYDRNGDGSTS